MRDQGFIAGFDDTDSPRGLCTTFLATEVIREFRDLDLIGYPALVRLNPNIPWKTRGNGAVALRFGKGAGRPFRAGTLEDGELPAHPRSGRCDIDLEEILERLDRVVLANSARGERATNPAVFVGRVRPPESLYRDAVRELVHPRDVLGKLKRGKGTLWLWRTHRGVRGIVGASAAAAWTGRRRTFELIAYRERERWGTPRNVRWGSVERMDRDFPSTFNNLDLRNRHVVIAPHSPCPVLFGIRAFGPGELWPAASAIESGERNYRMLLFRSNQGTDDHLQRTTVRRLREYESPRITGTVAGAPRTDIGGHVFFRLRDRSGELDCAAYEPTKEFRDVVRRLIVGDRIQALGGVHGRPFTLNLEKLRVMGLAPLVAVSKPVCPRCGGTMRSRGRDGGYRCRRCRTRAGPEAATREVRSRGLEEGSYEVPKCARRHLSRPFSR
jgi:tRNA(Ile2)-agmatinylcytidine synthase